MLRLVKKSNTELELLEDTDRIKHSNWTSSASSQFTSPFFYGKFSTNDSAVSLQGVRKK